MTAFRSAPKPDEVDRAALAKRAGGASSEGWLLVVLMGIPSLVLLVGALTTQNSRAGFAGIGLTVLTVVIAGHSFWTRARIRGTARDGLVGHGTILSARSQKRSVVFLLEVAVEGYDKFHAEAPEEISAVEAARLVGQEFPVVWHPRWPAQVLIASLPAPAAPRLGPQGPPRRKRRK